MAEFIEQMRSESVALEYIGIKSDMRDSILTELKKIYKI